MTKEGGFKRHDGHVHFDAIEVPPDGYVPGELITYQGPDPVRVAALANAVAIACAEIRAGQVSTWEAIIDRAAKFEAYLTGEEGHGPS